MKAQIDSPDTTGVRFQRHLNKPEHCAPRTSARIRQDEDRKGSQDVLLDFNLTERQC